MELTSYNDNIYYNMLLHILLNSLRGHTHISDINKYSSAKLSLM